MASAGLVVGCAMSTAAAAVGHDGVRMETPTILLASSGKAAPQLTRAWRGPGPHGLVLVASGSRGSKLIHVLPVHVLPAEQPAAKRADTVYGIESDVLADALLPKPSQRERCLDVSLGEVRFVGHPVTLVPLAASSSAAVPSLLGRQVSDKEKPSIDGLTVALVLAAHPPPGDEAAYERAQQACVRGAAVLVRALQRTEARRRVVSRAVHTEAGSTAAALQEAGGAKAGRRQQGGAALQEALQRALEALQGGREEALVLGAGEGEEEEEEEREEREERKEERERRSWGDAATGKNSTKEEKEKEKKKKRERRVERERKNVILAESPLSPLGQERRTFTQIVENAEKETLVLQVEEKQMLVERMESKLVSLVEKLSLAKRDCDERKVIKIRTEKMIQKISDVITEQAKETSRILKSTSDLEQQGGGGSGGSGGSGGTLSSFVWWNGNASWNPICF